MALHPRRLCHLHTSRRENLKSLLEFVSLNMRTWQKIVGLHVLTVILNKIFNREIVSSFLSVPIPNFKYVATLFYQLSKTNRKLNIHFMQSPYCCFTFQNTITLTETAYFLRCYTKGRTETLGYPSLAKNLTPLQTHIFLKYLLPKLIFH
jgi:hypothetical protein